MTGASRLTHNSQLTTHNFPSARDVPRASRGFLEEAVDLRRQDEIVLVESADLVRPEDEVHLVPVDRDVGVMALLLRDVGDAVDERDGFFEVLELEAACQ